MALDLGRRRLQRAVLRARSDGRPVPSTLIVGGGLSGLAAAIQLTRAGIRSFTILEQSDGVGGTWRDNAYPGSGCDVPSHLYSLSFATKSDWTRRFAEQPEILSYAESLVGRFDLGPHLRLGTTVDAASYDEASGRWLLEITGPEGGERLEADNVIFACGQLNRPSVPELPGQDRFAGPQWHSARWPTSPDLAGRRVAVVGSGASAIQFVPHVAAECAELTIYQHAPSYVAPKKDRTYQPRTVTLLRRSAVLERTYRWYLYWTLESRWLWFKRDSWLGRRLGELIASGIRTGVISERLPESSVVPDYPLGCKRILISNDWYATLLRPHVSVVDEPIDHLTGEAVVTRDGVSRATDVVIYGTGFATTEFLRHLPVTGRAGTRLDEVFAEGAHAYRGTVVPGFPNAYLLYGPNTNLGHNSILFMVERQLNLALQAMALQADGLEADAVPAVEVRAEAEAADDARTQARMAATSWVANCQSWYKNAAGRVTNNWPSWTFRFWWETLHLVRADFTSGPTSARGDSAPPDAR